MKASQSCTIAVLCLAILASQCSDRPVNALRTCGSQSYAADGASRAESAGTGAPRTGAALREIEREIEELQKESQRITRDGHQSDVERERWEIDIPLNVASKAERAGVERDLLEALLRSAVRDGAETIPPGCSSFGIARRTLAASAWIILEKKVFREEKEHLVPYLSKMPGHQARGGVAGMLTRWSVRDRDLFGTALAAIDSYEDRRATEFLLQIAAESSETEACPPWKAWALRFLTSCDTLAVKPRLQTLYVAGIKSTLIDGRVRTPHHSYSRSLAFRDMYIRSLAFVLDELEYVDSLEPAVARRYQRILRLAARAWSIAPQGGHIHDPSNAAVRAFYSDWKDGDERFLPHMMEGRYVTPGLPAAIGIGSGIAERMLRSAPISDDGVAWLRQ